MADFPQPVDSGVSKSHPKKPSRKPIANGKPVPNGKRARPTKVIPTERLTVKRQLDILRAFTAASGPSGKPVGNKEVAGILKIADTTVSLANNFFIETGLLVKGANGFVPAPEVVSYSRAYEWNPANAALKLAPLFAKAWFAEALTPKLSFRPMEEAEVIDTLAEVSAAAPDYRANLKLLIEFMEATGLTQREGSMIKLARSTSDGTSPAPEQITSSERELGPVATRSTVATTFTQPTEGVVQFHVSVKVEMAEFANWKPDRISAFFAGIAQVLAAKAAIEQQAGNG
jgi:hypothetical protein